MDEGILGTINSYDFNGEYVTWTTDGIYAGSVFYRNGKFNCTNVCGTLKAKNDSINMKYLSVILPQYTSDYVVRVANPKLMNNVMAEIKLPLPPLDIQQKIVDEIEKVEKQKFEIEKKTKNLIDNVSNIIDKITTKNMMTLQDVCSMKITDGTHQTPSYCSKEEGVPFISSKDVTTKKINWDENAIKYVVPELHERLYKRIAPQRDDVLLAKNGTIGVAALVETDRVFDIYVTLAVLRPNKNIILPKYLLYIVNSNFCYQQFTASIQKGMGVPNLHLNKIQTVKIPVPSLAEQQKIVSQIEEIEKQIEEAQKIIDNSKQQKQLILDKYLK